MNSIKIYIGKIRANKWAKWFIILLRIVIGLSFIYPSVPKILVERFTILTPDNPVGYFFDAMYKTGLYWQFIGIMQLITGLLLISQRFSALGALIYFPIILNIFVLVTSMHFVGTPVVTFFMLMAGVLFIVWDYEKFMPIFKK